MGASLSKLIQEYYVTDELMSDVTSLKMFSASWHDGPLTIYNSTMMDPLNATDSSPCMCRLSLSLACLTSVCSDHFPSCFLWRRHCSLASDAICLLRSVDSSALSYTVKSLPSQSIGIAQISFSMCTNLKSMLPSFPFVQLKVLVYGHTQTDRQTDIHTCLAMQSR